jgi:hypothetical protein
MPGRGRPRLTPEVYEARLGAYCAQYKVKPTREGLPPFPAGQRETPQHREWISLYKGHARLARRARGQCERCAEPVSEGSVFCEAHRAEAAAVGTISDDERRRLLKAQASRCPVCGDTIDAQEAVQQDAATGRPRALLHARCHRLAGLAEAAGPEAVDRLRAYLWPQSANPRRGRPRS